MNSRISRLQLGEIDLRLTDSDRRTLQTLKRLRFLKTDQLRRLFFADGHTTLQASKTSTLKQLRRLKRLGLINHLERQYNLGNYGSQAYMWYLTEAGNRLLELGLETDGKRNRVIESSPTFLRHTIAVAECYIQLETICRSEEELSIRVLEPEPECWRVYRKDGQDVSLRPDLYAETLCGKYRDRWFIEMDLDTEAIPIVIRKCRRYQEYYTTNLEQTVTGKFPVVMWLVPSERRKANLTQAIKETFGDRYVHMFLVITPDELHDILLNGVKQEDLC